MVVVFVLETACVSAPWTFDVSLEHKTDLEEETQVIFDERG